MRYKKQQKVQRSGKSFKNRLEKHNEVMSEIWEQHYEKQWVVQESLLNFYLVGESETGGTWHAY